MDIWNPNLHGSLHMFKKEQAHWNDILERIVSLKPCSTKKPKFGKRIELRRKYTSHYNNHLSNS